MSDPTLPHIALHIHSQRCGGCGTTTKWSQVFECITQNKMKKLLPARPKSAWPSDYEIIPTAMPVQFVPICHACLPDVKIEPDHAAHARWQETLARKAEQAKEARAQAPAAPRTAPTLDML